jgi:hypothetical protein
MSIFIFGKLSEIAAPYMKIKMQAIIKVSALLVHARRQRRHLEDINSGQTSILYHAEECSRARAIFESRAYFLAPRPKPVFRETSCF